MEVACEEYSVVLTIFSFLEVKELCLSAALVCKTWAQVAAEPLVRKTFVCRSFKTQVSCSCGKD